MCSFKVLGLWFWVCGFGVFGFGVFGFWFGFLVIGLRLLVCGFWVLVIGLRLLVFGFLFVGVYIVFRRGAKALFDPEPEQVPGVLGRMSHGLGF